jgi:formylglycine-generating enzyme required for sulfatase activity
VGAPGFDDHPASSISWNDAKAFCDWASKKTGRAVKLPTEAEWEYAYRAGTKTRWYFGDKESELKDHAWMDTNSTHPVGRKKPNPWGLYDLYGNVLEWCEDVAGPYPEGAVTDPVGTMGSRRCMRGGGIYESGACRSAYRRSEPAQSRHEQFGFRVTAR